MASITPVEPSSAGTLLRQWRQRRRMSQLELACEADISTRHLSFLETGRSRPSRGMLLRLAELLEVPLRERNSLLVAAGFAPRYAARALDDPALAPALDAVRQVLHGHEPYPAVAVDRHWNLVHANAAALRLLDGLPPALLAPPLNVLRLSLHPQGLAPRIVNLDEWREHLLARLRRLVSATADPVLAALYRELGGDGTDAGHAPPASDARGEAAPVLVPLRLSSPFGPLSLIGTITVFGTPLDITLAELAVEAFFPADAATARILRQLADGAG